MHELRRIDLLGAVRPRFDLVDIIKTGQGISGRDQRAVMKTASGLLKLLYSDGRISNEELEEGILFACELRQRVREQLHLIAPGEYNRVKLGVRLLPSGTHVGEIRFQVFCSQFVENSCVSTRNLLSFIII